MIALPLRWNGVVFMRKSYCSTKGKPIASSAVIMSNKWRWKGGGHEQCRPLFLCNGDRLHGNLFCQPVQSSKFSWCGSP